jgi:hypothetical protein
MTEPTTPRSPSTRTYNGWRTGTLVLALLCIALGVGWFMRERALRIDHDQERQDLRIQIDSLQRELDARPPAPGTEDDGSTAPTTGPTTRPS